MAKQTINIGAAPNDGTGTPLRTSFDYTNQNFTELYNALGGGVGLPGAINQVIFNNGTNLAGDGGLLYSSATDALTAGSFNPTASAIPSNGIYLPSSKNIGIAVDGVNVLNIDGIAGRVTTTGSATISGALDAARLNVTGATIPANGVYLGSANNLSFSAASTLAMTLNSTGLGVGVASPTHKLTVSTTAGATAIFTSSGAATAVTIDNTNANAWGGNLAIATGGVNAGFFGTIGSLVGSTSQNIAIWSTSGNGIVFHTNGDSTARAIIDTSGNVGIGGAPAAAVAGNKKLQITGSNNSAVVLGTSSVNAAARNWAVISNWNAFGDLVFQQSNALGGDPLASGAGTSRMTLDASGRLILLASTTTPATLTTNGELTMTATSNTNLRFSYRGSDGTTRVADITLA